MAEASKSAVVFAVTRYKTADTHNVTMAFEGERMFYMMFTVEQMISEFVVQEFFVKAESSKKVRVGRFGIVLSSGPDRVQMGELTMFSMYPKTSGKVVGGQMGVQAEEQPEVVQ